MPFNFHWGDNGKDICIWNTDVDDDDDEDDDLKFWGWMYWIFGTFFIWENCKYPINDKK